MPHSFLPGWIRRSAHQVLKVKDVWTLVCAGVIGMQLQKPVLVRSPASGIRDRPRAVGIQDGGYRSCWTISQEKRPMVKPVLAFNSLFCCFPRPLQWGDGVSCQTVGNCITAARGWQSMWSTASEDPNRIQQPVQPRSTVKPQDGVGIRRIYRYRIGRDNAAFQRIGWWACLRSLE